MKQFKDLIIGQQFHIGMSHGIGFNKDVIHKTIYEKVDKSHAKVIKSDWAPRQLNNIDQFSAFSPTFPIDNL